MCKHHIYFLVHIADTYKKIIKAQLQTTQYFVIVLLYNLLKNPLGRSIRLRN